jgi:hypothetical protein
VLYLNTHRPPKYVVESTNVKQPWERKFHLLTYRWWIRVRPICDLEARRRFRVSEHHRERGSQRKGSLCAAQWQPVRSTVAAWEVARGSRVGRNTVKNRGHGRHYRSGTWGPAPGKLFLEKVLRFGLSRQESTSQQLTKDGQKLLRLSRVHLVGVRA